MNKHWADIFRLSAAVTSFFAGIGIGFTDPAFADQGITDPKAWCGEITQLVATNRADELPAKLEEGSLGSLKPADATVALAQIEPFMEGGEVVSTSFLAEKIYSDAYARFWYLILVGHQPVFLRCAFIKYKDAWQITDFDFDTKIDRIPLP